MEQPIPSVTLADFDRILQRDYASVAEEVREAVLGVPGGVRVALAVLKLGQGSLEKLKEATKLARQDYRDVLCAAEYPEYARSVGFSTPSDERQKIIEADWRQYQSWLAS